MNLINLSKSFNCTADYFLEKIKGINLERLEKYFSQLPADPYLSGNYRFRRLSHLKIVKNQLIKLNSLPFYQSKDDNPLLGNVARIYPELDDRLITIPDFQKITQLFFEFCQLCTNINEIGIHQIRITTSNQQIGAPAPEGIHRDGVDLVGIFCVKRKDIEGGITNLYKAKDEQPIFSRILQPGEFLIFNDHQFFHYTSAITALNSGLRDVFVFTCPGSFAPDSSYSTVSRN
ncbi:2OG-Fe dioxygenase family protein [Gloeothece verrucosa]|uniref:2OG-Fe dioxygenase family protein n=1 Tax=Gloeothece verrucosa (strain PCC 7822) TaxID=497965 RepID=E0ULH0_GLOV7|nr:2OG-Fe dioxygenase family protein [Gloeothece verrucosa]ADN17800.1 Protein of unknown function DUF2257 [Gloeothece verrucosa PCC 7822]